MSHRLRPLPPVAEGGNWARGDSSPGPCRWPQMPPCLAVCTQYLTASPPRLYDVGVVMSVSQWRKPGQGSPSRCQ